MEKAEKLIRMLCLFFGLIVSVTVISDQTDPYGPLKAYAVGSEEYPKTFEDQAGLMGVADSIESLRSFDRASRTNWITSAGGQILAGAAGVKRSAVNRNAFYQGARKAGELGYDALEKIAENQLSYNDYYTLLCIVEAEATGGDVKSKQLIADVVINRVNDPHFPDNIYDVVWQNIGGDAQFSPTMDGRINTVTITDSTIQAVKNALEGEDISEGALFFLARKDSSSSNIQWFDENLVSLFSYGGHEFFTFKEYVN